MTMGEGELTRSAVICFLFLIFVVLRLLKSWPMAVVDELFARSRRVAFCLGVSGTWRPGPHGRPRAAP